MGLSQRSRQIAQANRGASGMRQTENKKDGPITFSGEHSALRGSFISAVTRNIRSYKLGDLLLHGGLISHAQLSEALRLQKESGEQIGKILIRQGYVSAVQVYRKLAEQWCVKASAAGVALMMQMSMPTDARAETNLSDGQVRLAAAFAPAALKPSKHKASYPELFGSSEVRSNDISAFTKWTSVIKRFEDQMETRNATPRVQMWKAALQDMKKKPTVAQIREVNDYINSIRYIEDKNNYSKSDYWATPVEFFSKGGDCEDFAIAKYASLRALGFSGEQMRIAIVQDKIKNIPHAVLIVYTDEGTFVLDNQDKRTRKMTEVVRYQPIFSINSNNWWLHRSAGV